MVQQLSCFIVLIALVFSITSCRHIEVNERTADIPGHEWQRKHKVLVSLAIKDSAIYHLYFIARHTEQYAFKNILADLAIQDSTKKELYFMKLNIPLVNKNGEWSGRKMDDLYDHYIKINRSVVLKPGRYWFIIQHQMKEDPLPYILNVGIGIDNVTGSGEQ